MSAAPRQPRALDGVMVGDWLRSSGLRWRVVSVDQKHVTAEWRGEGVYLRHSWRLSGKPVTAKGAAIVETPERAEADIAAKLLDDALAKLCMCKQRHGGILALPMGKALALSRFVDALTREGE